ncbi:MMPL family transporter [Candidatus Acetothermia bacterium]|nr:MMPL family transporter [Candidatus Acetothermia bacterium]
MSRWFNLTELSVNYPKTVILLTLAITAFFLLQFPKIKTDTDPKNMLPATSQVRVYNDQVDRWFALHKDVIVLGVVNDQGIFNTDTLARIVRLTDEIAKLQGVVARDVSSFTTVDNVTSKGDLLTVKPLMSKIPQNPQELQALRKALYENPLFLERLISKDGKTTAIYIPLEPTANGQEIADQIRKLLTKEDRPEKYYLAGDPIARDTFGAQMFLQMALFSPLAGLIMFLALYGMFRNLTLVGSVMAVAMISIVWSMGFLIGMGFPVHIMSSMIPVFLMAIATDSVHIFNEFYFRFRELRQKRAAILDTMRTVGAPVRYTALATAVGFATLSLVGFVALNAGHLIPIKGAIEPVMVFGLFVAFGTLALRLMSFSFIPAVMMLAPEEKLLKVSGHEDLESNWTVRGLSRLGEFSLTRSKFVIGASLLLVIVSIVGMSQIRVNNNMVSWFKTGSEIRQADTILNDRLGGTASAYVVASAEKQDFMKQPEALKYIDSLQRDLEKLPVVGKTISVADYVKWINRVMNRDDAAYYRVPEDEPTIAQYLLLFSMSAKPSDLDNVVDYPYQKANIWVQLKTWDAGAMHQIIDRVNAFAAAHPIKNISFQPAGVAYFNLVWDDEVLYGMLEGFILALVFVFVILTVNFRSWRWAVVSFVPLLFAITLIYGFIGFIKKDFDMPIAVLSTLSLGMAVDFAIHFVRRFQQRYQEDRDLEKALLWTVARPGKGILRNAVLFAAGFSVMIFASLTPYITVGLFIMAIMLLSALATLIFLPALIRLLPGWLLKEKILVSVGAASTTQPELNPEKESQ